MRSELIKRLSDCEIFDSHIEITFLYNHKEDESFIDFCKKNSLLENHISNTIENERVKLELSIAKLNTYKIYSDCKSFYAKNNVLGYVDDVYILEEKKYLKETLVGQSIKSIFELCQLLISINTFITKEIDMTKIGIVNDNTFFEMTLKVPYKTLENKKIINDETLEYFRIIIHGKITNRDKYVLFINELNSFLIDINKNDKLNFLSNNFDEYIERANLAHSIYLSDFSFNKIKLEVDNKILEYNQKLQGVINDAQNKLVTIPSAFVLVLIGMDYKNNEDYKNLIITASTFIFTIFIQIFIANQHTSIKFIKGNIKTYTDSFENNDTVFSKKFIELNEEYNKQKRRIDLLQFLTWLVPFSTLSLYFYILEYKSSWLIVTLYIIFYLIKHWVNYYSPELRINEKNNV